MKLSNNCYKHRKIGNFIFYLLGLSLMLPTLSSCSSKSDLLSFKDGRLFSVRTNKYKITETFDSRDTSKVEGKYVNLELELSYKSTSSLTLNASDFTLDFYDSGLQKLVTGSKGSYFYDKKESKINYYSSKKLVTDSIDNSQKYCVSFGTEETSIKGRSETFTLNSENNRVSLGILFDVSSLSEDYYLSKPNNGNDEGKPTYTLKYKENKKVLKVKDSDLESELSSTTTVVDDNNQDLHVAVSSSTLVRKVLVGNVDTYYKLAESDIETFSSINVYQGVFKLSSKFIKKIKEVVDVPEGQERTSFDFNIEDFRIYDKQNKKYLNVESFVKIDKTSNSVEHIRDGNIYDITTYEPKVSYYSAIKITDTSKLENGIRINFRVDSNSKLPSISKLQVMYKGKKVVG